MNPTVILVLAILLPTLLLAAAIPILIRVLRSEPEEAPPVVPPEPWYDPPAPLPDYSDPYAPAYVPESPPMPDPPVPKVTLPNPPKPLDGYLSLYRFRPPEDGWACPVCATENSPHRSSCQTCGWQDIR